MAALSCLSLCGLFLVLSQSSLSNPLSACYTGGVALAWLSIYQFQRGKTNDVDIG